MSTWLEDSEKEEDDGDERDHPTVICKRCGERGLVWKSVNHRWRLAYPEYDGGELHTCRRSSDSPVDPCPDPPVA